MTKLERLGNIYGEQFGTGYAGNVWDSEGLCPTIKNEGGGGGRTPMIISTNGSEVSGTIRATYYKNGERNIEANVMNGLGYEGVVEPMIAASRGRNPDNPSDRTTGSPTEQRLEIKIDGTSNTLTSVAKDNYVLEPEVVGIKQATQKGYIECELGGVADLSYPDSKFRRGRVQGKGQISPTLTGSPGICRIEGVNTEEDGTSRCIKAQYYKTSGANFLRDGDFGATGVSKTDSNTDVGYRIRKLTPRECWRLMDFTDEDFDKAQAVNSNTQLYKQAGNSIVKNVLIAILGQMFEGHELQYAEK